MNGTHWNKGIGLIMLLVMLATLSCTAHASGVHKATPDRFEAYLPGGMVTAYEHESAGELRITIDDLKTDWGRAMLYGYDSSAVDVDIRIEGPADAAYYVLTSGEEGDETERIEELNEWDKEDYIEGSLAANGMTVAQCVNEYRAVMPWAEENYLYIRWFNEDKEEIQTEKLHVSVSHTQSKGVHAPVYTILPELIQPDRNSADVLRASADDGVVTYVVAVQEKEKGNHARPGVVTGVSVPEGAVACKRLSLYEGDCELEIVNGMISVETEIPRKGIDRCTYGLEFLDQGGEVISCGLLTVQFVTAEMEPWPSYVDRFKPVPSDKLLVEIGGASGVAMPYENGMLSYDYARLADTPQAIESGEINVRVEPHPQAKYVKVAYVGGGEGLLGRREDEEESFSEALEWADEAAAVRGPVEVIRCPALNGFDMANGPTLYVPTVPTNLDAGMAYILFWFKSKEAVQNDDPCEVWWFAETSEPFVKAIEKEAVLSEEQMGELDGGAVIISDKNWIMVTELLLSDAADKQHYELRLIDGNGMPVNLDKEHVVYLPYPPGGSFEDGRVYTLRHYLPDGRVIPVELTPTKKGLRFKTASFSPFVLAWEAASQTAQLPQTGDDSSIGVWISLLILCAAVCVGRRVYA